MSLLYQRRCDGCGKRINHIRPLCDACVLTQLQEDARISTWALTGYPKFRKMLAAHAAFEEWLAEHRV